MSTAMARSDHETQPELGIIGPIRDCPEVKLRGNPGRAEYCEHCLALSFCSELFSTEDNSNESWEILAQFVGSKNVDEVLMFVQERNREHAELTELRQEIEHRAKKQSYPKKVEREPVVPQHQLPKRKVEV